MEFYRADILYDPLHFSYDRFSTPMNRMEMPIEGYLCPEDTYLPRYYSRWYGVHGVWCLNEESSSSSNMNEKGGEGVGKWVGRRYLPSSKYLYLSCKYLPLLEVYDVSR